MARAWRQRLIPISDVLPGAVAGAASAVTVITGILLLLLAHALRRRKRRAWRAVVVLLSLSVVVHGLKAEPVAALIPLALLVVLIVYRAEFYALGDPTTRWRAVRALLVLTVVSLVIGYLVVALARGTVAGGPATVWDRAQEVLTGLVGFSGPVVYRSERVGDLVGAVLLGLGLLTAPDHGLPRAARAGAPADADRRGRGPDADLLERSPDSLGYFNLRRDKSVVWSESGKAAIAYRVVSGTMLASGDPIGDPEAWPGAMAAFLREAQVHAWTPAVIGCSERAGQVWCRHTGFTALELGDEAVVDARTFSLEGRPMRNVRQMVKRIERAGYTTEICRARDVSEGERRRALADAAAWRSTETERGFSMALGRVVDPADPDCVWVVARQDGVMRAFLQFVPWGTDGMSLDLMRRDRTAEPGVNELLIVHAARRRPGAGRHPGVAELRRLPLRLRAGRAPRCRPDGAGVAPGPASSPPAGSRSRASTASTPSSSPSWVPRFVVYPHTADLPRVAMAALEAEAFLTWPSLRRLTKVFA